VGSTGAVINDNNGIEIGISIMRRCFRVFALLISVLGFSGARVAPLYAAAAVAAGKEKAELCVGCHGENGISQTENIPSLAGQPDQFIQWQLVFFRGGARKNEQMQAIAEQISNDDIRSLGAYYASLTPPRDSKSDDNPDLSRKGAEAAVGRRCASCHTDSFAGTKAVARIAGQREEYLVKSLHDYKSGARTGGAGAAMTDVAYPLSDEEIAALAHYLAHL
jgi:cytochrome c553